MKVLLVDSWGHGGISTFCAYLAHHLTDAGVSVDAFCYMSEWPDAYMLRPYCGLMQKAPTSLTDVLIQNEYDIVHFSTCAFGYPLSAAVHLRRARFKGRVIATAHTSNEGAIPSGIVDALTAVSESAAEDLRRTNVQEVIAINNGIDTKLFCAGIVEKPACPILGWVGRAEDTHAKDILGFLYLISALHDAGFDFWIVDGSREPSEVMKRLPDWLGNRVQYTHRMPYSELPNFYRMVSASGGALLSTSAWEGIGFTVLEAWGCGCPTILPRIKGLEYAERYAASLMYNRQDAIKQIIPLVTEVQEQSKRSQLTANAQIAVEREFNVERMARRYLEVYEGLCASQPIKAHTVFDTISRIFWATATKARQFLRSRTKTVT